MQQDVYDLIFQESKPEEEEDVYSLIFKESKKEPEIPEPVLPEPEAKPSIFERIRPFAEKLLPRLEMGGPAYTQAKMMLEKGVSEREEEERRKEALLQAPEMPGIRAITPEEERLEVPTWALERKLPKEIAGWSKDPKVNYISEKIAERAPLYLTGAALGFPAIVAIFEGLQQARNVIVALKEKSKYDPLAERSAEELLSEDTPGWLRTTVEIGEPIFDMVVAAVLGKKLSPKVMTKALEIFYKKAVSRGHPPKPLKRVIERLLSTKVIKPETLDAELARLVKIKRAEIPAPVGRRIGMPVEALEAPIIAEAPRLAPLTRIPTQRGLAFPPEAKVNIKPQPDGSVDITLPRPVAPPVTEPPVEAPPEIAPRVVEKVKPLVYKDELLEDINDLVGKIKPNPDYSRAELMKILPLRMIGAIDDPSAVPMDIAAQALSHKYPDIEGNTELYDRLATRKRLPTRREVGRAEEERIEREYEEFRETERRGRPRYVEQALGKPLATQKEISKDIGDYIKELEIEGKELAGEKRFLEAKELEPRIRRIEAEKKSLDEEIRRQEVEVKPEVAVELKKITPMAKAIEKALKERKELTAEQKEFLKKERIYEEKKLLKKVEVPEPEIEKLPERMNIAKVSIETPTGEIEELGELTADRIDRVKKYAKQVGLEDKLKVGATFKGKWGERLAPREIETYMKEVIRDVKKVPKEEWELYAGYPLTKEIKEAISRIRERTKTKKRIKLEELKGELQRTDTGKVEWMYLESNRQLKERKKPSFKKAFKGAKRAFIDTSGNVKKELIKDLGPLGKEAAIRHDLIAGANAKADRLFEEAKKKIYSKLSKADEDLLNGVIQSRRTIAISKYKPEVRHPFGLTDKEHSEYIKTIPKEINDRADLYFKEMEKVLDDLKSEGLIDAESYQNLKSKGDYSPRLFIQYIDPPAKGYDSMGRIITVPDSGIKALDEGSYQVMETNSRLLLESVVSRTQARIFRNRANKAGYNLAKEFPDNGIFKLAKVYKTTKKGKPIYQKAPAGHTKLKVMIEGKAKEMIMPDKYAKEWLTRDPLINQQLALWIGWLSGSRFLKPMATGLNPGFALTNFPRDIAHVWIVTSEYSSFIPKYLLQMRKDLKETKKDAFSRKGRWIDYIDEGGGMTFLTHQGRPFKNANEKLMMAQKVMGYAGEASEIWTRLALRERALKEGKKPYEATQIARNYLDFSQGGNISKALDTGIPYLNAGIQGTRGIFRALADRPVDTLWKFAQLGVLASGLYLANNLLNKECMDHITDREKVNNWIFSTPFRFTDKNGNRRYLYFKIAKDQGQRIACTLVENLMRKALGKEVNSDQIVQSVQDFIPIVPDQLLPPSIDGMMGYMANRDFWTRKDIWRGDKITPREEYTIYTHPALVKLGAATGWSPERLEYFLSQVFTRGNVYTSIVNGGLTLAMQSLPKEDKRKTTTEMVARLPLIRRVFGVTPPYSVEEIKKLEKASMEESTRKHKQKRELSEMANTYYRKLKDEKIKDRPLLYEIKVFIRKQPAEDRKRLVSWFKNYGIVYDIPDRAWWLNLAEMSPEARATVFWTKYLETEKEERKALERLGRKIPGLWSDRFLKRLRMLISKWKKEQ